MTVMFTESVDVRLFWSVTVSSNVSTSFAVTAGAVNVGLAAVALLSVTIVPPVCDQA